MNYAIRIVRQGDAYGLRHCVTHDKPEPMIEVYDTDYAGDKRFDLEGQFVSRYYASTLLEDHPKGCGLDLCGDVPKWKLSAAQFEELLAQIPDDIKAEYGGK